MATKVGTGPHTAPDMPSTIDRESMMKPFSRGMFICMINMPISPIPIPFTIF